MEGPQQKNTCKNFLLRSLHKNGKGLALCPFSYAGIHYDCDFLRPQDSGPRSAASLTHNQTMKALVRGADAVVALAVFGLDATQAAQAVVEFVSLPSV